MPSIVIKLNRAQAIELHGITLGMEGDGIYKGVRQKVRASILKAWPEINPETAGETEPGVTREIEVDPKEQRSLAEGFLSLANNPKTTDRDYEAIKWIASSCRLWGWVEKHLAQRQVPDFDGELDGEPDLVDAETKDAA